MKNGIFVLSPSSFDLIYGDEHFREIGRLVKIAAPVQTAETVRGTPALRDAELLFSGWGAPVMDETFLQAAPSLKAVFYGAGSVRGFVTDALWKRGIVVTSAAPMNALPVAEFALAQILFSLKRGWLHLMEVKRTHIPEGTAQPVPGAYKAKVGIISLGVIGMRICELLKPFDIEVWAHDPFVRDDTFSALGVRRAGLDELFENCNVVSLHTPNLPSTHGLITGAHFARMKRDATFINTARGDVIREPEMVEVLARRPDIWAVLDVLAQEDRSAREKLLQLPNVIITPHIAGSMGPECRRMGHAMVEELKRYLNGEPLRWQVTRDRLAIMA